MVDMLLLSRSPFAIAFLVHMIHLFLLLPGNRVNNYVMLHVGGHGPSIENSESIVLHLLLLLLCVCRL